jgi:hypothetical protein
MNYTEAYQWDEALAQTTGYEHALVLSALEERIHTWATRLSEWDEGSTDERLWTWRSHNMRAYVEWTVRCDGDLCLGGTCSWGRDGSFKIDVQYARTDIDCPTPIEEMISTAWFNTPFGGPFDGVGGLFTDEDLDIAEELKDLSDAEFEAMLNALFED